MALEGIVQVIVFPDKATVWVLALVYDEDGELADPTAVELELLDQDGVVKAGYLSVTDSSTFTAGLVVTGATSGAKGLVISKPDGTTLELQQIIGVWQSGEVITDTGAGTSTTTSTIASVPMTQYETTTGIYEYFYHTGASADPMDAGQWRGEIVTIDGSGATAVISSSKFAFEVK